MPASPPALRLGRELSRLRKAAGYGDPKGIDRVAAATKISRATIYRAEGGDGQKKDRDIEALLKLYGASPERIAALMELVQQTKKPGWWAAYDIPEYLKLYLGMEEAAAEICWFEPLLIPGHLQTEDYARTVITADKPDVDDAEIASLIEFRMHRQRVIFRAERPPTIHVVIGEEALRRQIAGPAVQATQLERLVEAADLTNVSVRVAPIAVGFYQGVGTGPFHVLRFPPDSDGVVYETPIVYSELFFSAGYFDKPDEVSQYTAAFEDIRRCTLNEADSQTLIKNSIEELRHEYQ